jgi:steroid 5-alpha reductase family enzyme
MIIAVLGLTAAVMAAMLLVMTVGWFVQRAVGNAGWVDVFWTYGTGATCALAALVPLSGYGAPSPRQLMVAGLVAVWSLRLGTYVAVRVAKGPEDARYAGFRRDWGARFQSRMLGVMLIQAPATAALSISILFAARNAQPGLGLTDLIGLLILVVAILGEGVADGQMKRFKADPAHTGQVCDQGLWAWSRHPNYLFEFIGWLAYPVIAFRADDPLTLLALVGPALMFAILRFGTGVPPLEAAMLESRGDAYRRYQARVSPFLPRRPKPSPSPPRPPREISA